MRSARVELILDTLKAQRGARDLTKEVGGTARAFTDTARQGALAGQAIDAAGDEMSEAARAAAALDRQIDELTGSLRQMAIAQALTGQNDFAKQMREQEAQIRRLTRNKKLFADIGQEAGDTIGATLGISTSQGLFASLTTSLKAPPPFFLAAIGAMGASIAPLLGAAVAGGIIGGAAGGGVIGGLVIAAQDERVQAAAKGIAASIGGRLRDAALPFVDGALDGLAVLEQGFNRVDGNVRNIMRNASTFVRPLATGVTDFLEPVTRGLDALISKASPVITAIQRGLADVGRAIGDVFQSLADNGVEAGMAISVVFKGIESAVRVVGGIINGLTEAFGFLVNMADKLGFLSDEGKDKLVSLRFSTDAMTGSASAGASSFGGFKAAIKDTGKAASATKTEFVALNEQIANTVNRNLSATEANLALRRSLYEATKAADKKAEVTYTEQQALVALARSTNNSTKALDEQGRSVGEATRAHEANRKKLVEVAVRMGYTEAQAKSLANQYLAIPKNVNTRIGQPGMPVGQKEVAKYDKQLDGLARQINTVVKVQGDGRAYAQLEKLLVQQHALKKGISISAAASAFNKQEQSAFHEGGWTGPGAKMQPAGTVHADEFVIRKESRQRIERRAPGLLSEMNATGQVPGYAGGGRVINAPFPVNASITKIMSLAEALSKVTPSFGNWPSSPGAQRGDSGIWRRIVSLIRGTGPLSGSFGNGYRPGDPLWHGSGRAVDWMGYNQDALARFLAARRPLELIHRTRNRDYAYTRGRNMGSFNEGLMNAHRNHIHIAMARGGVLNEPVFGVGRSGATYSLAENGPERVTPMGRSSAGGNTYVTVQAGYVVSERDLENKITATVDTLIRKGRIG